MQKVCPHCKSKRIKVRSGVYSIAEVVFENDEFKYNIIEDESRVNDPYECAECGKQLTQADLVDYSVKCPKCGREVPPEKIVDGSCDICKLFEECPDIENMSMEDILREYVINKKASKTPRKVEKQEVTQEVQEPTKKRVARKKNDLSDVPRVDAEVTEYHKEEEATKEKKEPSVPEADEPPMPSLDSFLKKSDEEEEKTEEEPKKDDEGFVMFDPKTVSF